MNSNCLFCNIVRGATTAHKVGEDAQHLAFLTPFPNTKGVTVVITKAHHSSYVLAAEKAIFCDLLLFARAMGNKIDRNLGVQRTALVAEGYGIDHLHVKLFPMHGVEHEKWQPINSKVRDFYENYTGMIASNDGPRIDETQLAATAAQIQGEEKLHVPAD